MPLSREVNSSFAFATAEQRERLVEAERKVTDDRVRKIIALKRKVCEHGGSFVVINQKGIDPLSLDSFAKEGILGLRRAKKRNMERLALACGGVCVNSVDELSPEVLGHAGLVYEQTLGEEKYTFVEDVRDPHSCTILVKGLEAQAVVWTWRVKKGRAAESVFETCLRLAAERQGPNPHTIGQIKDAIRDGLRAARNAIIDKGVVPGAGCFELACHDALMSYALTIPNTSVSGIKALAEALLIVPKVLAVNSGFDPIEVLVKLQEEHHHGSKVGMDVMTGEPIDPQAEAIFDNYSVKRQILNSSVVMTSQLMLVDEVLKAGKAGAPSGPQQ